MTDIKLFRTDNGMVHELAGRSVALERSLQQLIESNLEAFFGIRFLASEYATGRTHGGRIDTLGIDENHVLVIIEYKRSTNENVINQGPFYLDWLLDHKAEFELLVQNRLGHNAAGLIEWTSPRLLCIAGDFTKYDKSAVQQINRSIELTRYVRYGEDLLLFELVNAAASDQDVTGPSSTRSERAVAPTSSGQRTAAGQLERANAQLTDLYEELKIYLANLGDDVQIKTLKYYIAFKRFRNFACVEIHRQTAKLVVFLKVDPDTIELQPGFTRDVRNTGHYGTGDLEVTLQTRDDLERAKPLLDCSYEAS